MPQIKNMSREEITEELRGHVHDEVFCNWVPNQNTQILAALLQFHRYGGVNGPTPHTTLTPVVKVPVLTA
jgi:hypothetical protein